MHQYVSMVVSALSARSAVGVQSASTVVSAIDARSVAGQESASTVLSAISARSAVVHQSASTVVGALSARSAVGHKYASTVVGALSARSAVGHQYASTVVTATGAKIATRRNSSFVLDQRDLALPLVTVTRRVARLVRLARVASSSPHSSRIAHTTGRGTERRRQRRTHRRLQHNLCPQRYKVGHLHAHCALKQIEPSIVESEQRGQLVEAFVDEDVGIAT